ncbi:hypothetical protein GL50803_0027024 [Giardia duodenalis]|uniref:Uncharacterized protein n=1 Tax=Giardia intestinalis (strain ATCC 50803 / WB clone C6) TaxID=184922 RepID=D3KH65_GIAIC|nr:hypothetical protein GL50803_0027024 [Giardia intestinalis]KAE8302231.1 hypothetical protein GL50803_0027024 [Giardia intestinalis]
MDRILDAIFQRIATRGHLVEQDFSDLQCFYPEELEHVAMLLDSTQHITVYRPARGLFGSVFYTVVDHAQICLVLPDEGYCSCCHPLRLQTKLPKENLCSRFSIMCTFCRHLLAVQIAIALKLPIKEESDQNQYETTFFTLISTVPGHLS